MIFKDSYFVQLPKSQNYGENARDSHLFYNDYFISLGGYSSVSGEFLKIWKLGERIDFLHEVKISNSNYSNTFSSYLSVYEKYLFVEIPFPTFKLRIFDLSQLPNKLIEIKQWDGSYVNSWEGNPFNGITINGNYVYRYLYGLKIYDITIPSEPEEVSVINKPGLQNFKITDNFAYIEFTENRADKIAIFNISDPTNPTEIDIVQEANAEITGYSAKEKNLYVLWQNTDNGKTTNNYVFITYGLKDDSTIATLDSYLFSGNNIKYYLQLYDDYAYIFPYAVLDISDPATIVEKSFMKNIPTISNYITNPFYDKNHSGYYIVSPNYCVLFVAYHAQCHLTINISFINISDPHNITPDVSFPSPITFDCGYGYGSDISVVSVSDKYAAYSSYTESCAIFAGCRKSGYNYTVYQRAFDTALELLLFKAKVRKKWVLLKWKIASKAGVYGF